MDGWIDTTCASSGLGPRWARVSTRLAASLETTHRESFDVSARDTALGSEELTSDVPHADVDHLDPATGLAREGTAVKPGMILVGKVSPKGGGPPLEPEEQLLRSIFGERADEVRDTSLRAPPGVRGVVVAARREPPVEKGEVARASVTVEWTRPLAVGDTLEIEGRGEVVVCAIDASVGGLEVDGVHGMARVAKRLLAEDALHMRSIGPYSLISQQPLGGKAQFGGQRLEEHHLRALVGAGAPWTAGECLTIKSDDIEGRIRAYESLVLGTRLQPYASGASVEPAPSPRVQIESAKVLRAEALALGFEIGWGEGRASARWLGPQAILERSSGEVKKPETINYRTLEPEHEGLFCARIFGPVRDYECLCGKYRRMKHRGVTCESCGVEVIASRVRRERFGHVTLAAPVLHPWLVEPIARLLGLGEAEVRERTGRGARELLEAVDLAALAGERSPRGALARALSAAGLAPIDLVVTVVPVLPPDLRPLVPLEGGRFATSDLNDLYRRLINRNNRTRRLIELDAPAIIIDSEVRKLEEGYAQLLQNMYERKTVTGPDKRPLRCLASGFAARGSQNLVGKRVDYSGRAQLVVDGALGERECRVPRAMALELFKPHLYSALERAGYVTTVKAAKRMVEATIDALHGSGPSEPEPRPSLDRPVDELEMSVATATALSGAGIATVRELVAHTEAELLKTKRFDRKSLRELSAILSDLGLSLGMAPGEPARPVAGPAQVLALLERVVAGHPVVLVGTERVLCREATLWDHPAVAVSPATASLLVDRTIAVHVPLTDQAKAECARLSDVAAPVERVASGWLTAILFGSAGPRALAQAAIEGEVDPLTDPVARLALGLPPPVLEARSA